METDYNYKKVASEFKPFTEELKKTQGEIQKIQKDLHSVIDGSIKELQKSLPQKSWLSRSRVYGNESESTKIKEKLGELKKIKEDLRSLTKLNPHDATQKANRILDSVNGVLNSRTELSELKKASKEIESKIGLLQGKIVEEIGKINKVTQNIIKAWGKEGSTLNKRVNFTYSSKVEPLIIGLQSHGLIASYDFDRKSLAEIEKKFTAVAKLHRKEVQKEARQGKSIFKPSIELWGNLEKLKTELEDRKQALRVSVFKSFNLINTLSKNSTLSDPGLGLSDNLLENISQYAIKKEGDPLKLFQESKSIIKHWGEVFEKNPLLSKNLPPLVLNELQFVLSSFDVLASQIQSIEKEEAALKLIPEKSREEIQNQIDYQVSNLDDRIMSALKNFQMVKYVQLSEMREQLKGIEEQKPQNLQSFVEARNYQAAVKKMIELQNTQIQAIKDLHPIDQIKTLQWMGGELDQKKDVKQIQLLDKALQAISHPQAIAKPLQSFLDELRDLRKHYESNAQLTHLETVDECIRLIENKLSLPTVSGALKSTIAAYKQSDETLAELKTSIAKLKDLSPLDQLTILAKRYAQTNPVVGDVLSLENIVDNLKTEIEIIQGQLNSNENPLSLNDLNESIRNKNFNHALKLYKDHCAALTADLPNALIESGVLKAFSNNLEIAQKMDLLMQKLVDQKTESLKPFQENIYTSKKLKDSFSEELALKSGFEPKNVKLKLLTLNQAQKMRDEIDKHYEEQNASIKKFNEQMASLDTLRIDKRLLKDLDGQLNVIQKGQKQLEKAITNYQKMRQRLIDQST